MATLLASIRSHRTKRWKTACVVATATKRWETLAFASTVWRRWLPCLLGTNRAPSADYNAGSSPHFEVFIQQRSSGERSVWRSYPDLFHGDCQRLLDLLKSGDADASRQLLDVTMERLRILSAKILADIPGVARWEEIDDLVQNSSLRLWRALEKHHPPTPLDYFRLAAATIRRELIDLSRHYFGPQGIGANHAKSWLNSSSSNVKHEPVGNSTFDPIKLSSWTEFHEYVEKLPEDERILFDLLWYEV